VARARAHLRADVPGTAAEAVQRARGLQPDVVLIDIRLREEVRFSAARQAARDCANEVMASTNADDRQFLNASRPMPSPAVPPYRYATSTASVISASDAPAARASSASEATPSGCART
jgi:CheY-like chemotaxis protein